MNTFSLAFACAPSFWAQRLECRNHMPVEG